jgi:thiol-disulfide isomerase/thioredoxin
VFAFACGAVLLASACSSARGQDQSTSPQPGLTLYPVAARRPVAELSGATLSGGSFALRAHRDHVVVINVWASWCSPCRAESPLLARLARQLQPRGINFVGIDEHDEASAARRFADGSGARYPQLFDPAGRALARLPQLPQMAIPSTLIIDPKGRIAGRIVGAARAGAIRAAVTAATPGSRQ